MALIFDNNEFIIQVLSVIPFGICMDKSKCNGTPGRSRRPDAHACRLRFVLGLAQALSVLLAYGMPEMDETLTKQDLVHKDIVCEDVSQQPIILVLARTIEFKANGSTANQPLVGKRRFLGVRVPCLWRVDTEIADATAVFQPTGIPINNPANGDGLRVDGALK